MAKGMNQRGPDPSPAPVPTPTLSGAWGRLGFALRLAVLGGVAIFAVGLIDHLSEFPLLTSALGPTAYVLIAHPDSQSARLRNAIVGHTTGIAAGLAALAIFGLWNAPSTVKIGHASLAQAAASGLAVAVTLLALHAVRAHHAPAAASALLVSTGLARPGPPLYGLIAGLAAILLAVSILNRLPVPAGQTHDDP